MKVFVSVWGRTCWIRYANMVHYAQQELCRQPSRACVSVNPLAYTGNSNTPAKRRRDFYNHIYDGGRGGDGRQGDGRLVQVGELLRIYWTVSEVWFRCRVVGVQGGGRKVNVEYLLPGWEPFVHNLDEVQWERWAVGGEVDPEEASYHPDVWMGPEDREASAAAEAARHRAASQLTRESGTTAEARRGRSESQEVGSTRDSARAVRGEETPGAAAVTGDGRGESCRFGWLEAAVDKGRGAKKRKTLARTLALAWDGACENDGHAPMVMLREVYRLMSKVMGAKDVKEELKKMASAGLVVLVGDTVGCGQRRSAGVGRDEGSADARGREASSGGLAVTGKRRREGHEDGGDGGGTEARGGVGEGGGRARRRRGGGEHTRPVYVESEQESGEGTGDEWG